jgi:hypothetical protein
MVYVKANNFNKTNVLLIGKEGTNMGGYNDYLRVGKYKYNLNSKTSAFVYHTGTRILTGQW